jgi:hypothetical protein
MKSNTGAAARAKPAWRFLQELEECHAIPSQLKEFRDFCDNKY